MRINNLHLNGVVVGQVRESDVPRPEPTEASAAEVSSHAYSPELKRWLSLAIAQPETRDEAITRVSALLVSGYYLTPECAQQVARAMLNARE